MKANFRPIFNQNRVPLNEVLPLDTPFCVALVPTQLCNIKCKYCLHSLSVEQLRDKKFELKSMNIDTFNLAIKQLKDFPRKIKSINVSGQGEPLCDKLISEKIKIIKDSNITDNISFITNGILLTHKLSKELIDAGLDRLFVSLQGISGKKYEEICGLNIDFEKFVDELKYFYEYSRGKCQLNIKIADIALEDGDKEKFFEIFGDYCDNIHIETIKPLYADVDYNGIINGYDNNMTLNRFGREHKKQKACYLSFYMLEVTVNGDIQVCGAPFDGTFGKLGNINNTTLLEAWNSKERNDFLIEMLKGNRCNNSICKDCDYPNDVPFEGDEIDPYADELLERYLTHK